MKQLKRYLLNNYSSTFFPIFVTLYMITSIIYLVRISTLTSAIEINFLELIQLYSYVLPTILFYTLPISLFVSISLSLAKLSSEYELIVITSFGFNPLRIIKIFLPSLLFATFFLLFNSLVLIPKADSKYNNFKHKKQLEAQFNIKASEYGQQFASWLLYVNKEIKNGEYQDIVLYKQEKNKDVFIIANYAKLINNKSNLSLILKQGQVVELTDIFTQIDFDQLVINNKLKEFKQIETINDIIAYWLELKTNKKKEWKFAFHILLSLFPLISVLFIVYIGYYNPRYQSNTSTIIAIVISTIYLILSQKLARKFGLDAMLWIICCWVFASALVYKFKIKPYY